MSGNWKIPVVPPRDATAERLARERQDALLKPRGSLGRLESLAVALAGMTGGVPGDAWPPAILVFVADHGVADGRQVSAYPQAVTAQMVQSYSAGLAAINVLAGLRGARLHVVDVGVAIELPELPGVTKARVGAGSRDLTREAALTRAEYEGAVAAGAGAAENEIAAGAGLLVVGEMGIGNTTAASAVVAGLTGADPAAVTGRGSGVDPGGWEAKVGVVREALRRIGAEGSEPCRGGRGGGVEGPAVGGRGPGALLETVGGGVLRQVGGFEIAALVGAILAAAARRVPVLLDGFVTGAAALAAVALRPGARHFLIAAHRSPEPGHRVVLDELGLEPLLDLGLRLGEASGAALALPLVEAAIRLHHETATFEDAGVGEGTR